MMPSIAEVIKYEGDNLTLEYNGIIENLIINI